MSGGEKPMNRDAWCILRTAPGQTLRLARSLNDAEFEAWTPAETIERKVRGSSKREAVVVPMLPSFVFVRADRLVELIDLARSPALIFRVWDREQRRMVAKGHPAFRIFRHGDDYPLVPDAQLAPLHAIEQRRRRKPRGKVHTFKPGAQVKLTEGGFAGLTGVVTGMEGKFARVQFAGFNVPVKISAWLLVPVLDDGKGIQVDNLNSERLDRTGPPLKRLSVGH